MFGHSKRAGLGALITRWVVPALVGSVVAATVLVPLAATPAYAAPVSLTPLTAVYTQDFNTLAATGTSAATPNGWSFTELGTNADTTYTVGTGNDNAGDTYSFGLSGSTERGFGGLQSGSLLPIIGASFTNATGSEITAFHIGYTGEQWRLGALRGFPDRLDFQYSLDATSLTTGTWTDVNALDFSSPIVGPTVGSLNGNAAANRTAITSTVSGLLIADGTTFWIRWTDFNVSGSDDGLAVDDFSMSFNTVDETVCGEAATFIHDIQGSGATAAQTGVRTIEGVVVGDYQEAGSLGGYFVQEEDGDSDTNPLTSEGIFVFNTSFAVSAGDQVRVRGTVVEFGGLTELSNVSAPSICGTGSSVTPTLVTLPVAAVSDLERFEGMRVDFIQELTVTDVFTLARFGEVSLSVGGRLPNPTNVVAPGAPAIALQDLNNRSRILLDDGNGQQNIEPTRYPLGGLSASNTLRVGDTLPGLTGVLDQRFGGVYRVQPVAAIHFTHANPRPAAPDPVGGNVQVAAFDVLNYFNGDGAGGGFPTARGANTLVEFNRQRDKIIAAITALDADVIGLMELENDDTDAEFGAIEDLIAGLNAAAGPGTYDFIDTGVVGTDATRVGIIYQPAVVTPVGSHAIIDSSVDPRFIDTLNQPSIAQTFALTATGARFTAVVNHLKSKGSNCTRVGDPDAGDGQGNCNLTRTMAAAAMVDWLATDPTGSGDPDVLLLGDMNAYAMEDPITTFRNAGFVNTIAEFLGDGAYSFVFQGQSGYLEHALASPSLAAQVSAVTEWHANADEPAALDYNHEFKTPSQVGSFYSPDGYRSSDHDPVLMGLDLNASPAVDAGGLYAVVEGSSVTVTATASDLDGDPLSYEWDLDNDGTFDTAGQSATFSAAGLEAPASRTITVRVTDDGGLSALDTAVVNVIWAFDGFFSPIDNLPTLNPVRAGRSVPINFSLSGDQGMAILAAGSPSSTEIACDAGAPIGPVVEEAVAAGHSGVVYDASTDTYTYPWKTSKDWTGCRRLTVILADGTIHQADFLFTR